MSARRDLRSRLRSLRLAAVTVAACALGASGATAAFATLGGSSGFRSWTVKPPSGAEFTVSQLLVPALASLRLGEHASLAVSAAAASSRLDVEGGPSPGLDGASPLVAQLYWRAAGDRVLIQAGVAPPSGTRELSADEFQVMGVLGLPILGFGLKQYGRGGELNGAVSYAAPVGAASTASIGAGFTVRGEYTLLANGEDYRPASDWAISAGLNLGDRGDDDAGAEPVRLDATFRSFGKDESGGAPVFEEGDQLDLQAQRRTSGDGLRSAGLVRLVFKGESTVIGSGASAVPELKVNSGNGLFLRLGGDWPQGETRRLGLGAEWNHVGGSDTFGRNGDAFGIGPTADLRFGGLALRLHALKLWGTLDGGDAGDVDLSGFSLGATARWDAGR